MAASPNWALDRFVEGQSGVVPGNLDFNKLDATAPIFTIKDRDLATPPGSPAEGDAYLIAASPTGAWATHAATITAYYNGWAYFLTPKEGWMLWVQDEDKLLRYTGAAWKEVAIVSLQSRSITILAAGAAENLGVWFTPVAVTISKLVAVFRGGSSPSCTYNIKHDPTRSNAGNSVMSANLAVTSTTTGSVVTTFAGGDPTIPANSFVWFISSASSGTAGSAFEVTIVFSEDG